MGGRNTTRDIRELYREGEPIAMVTCYDYAFAKLVDRAGLDAVLIGDSLGNVVQGEETTLPVTLDEIVYHARAVGRGTENAHVIADLPFMSYQVSVEEAVRNAGRVLKESAVQAVKVEGGREVVPAVERMVEVGIPVMGHLGLTPQSIHEVGGYRVQGREDEAADELIEDARALEEAGVYSLVLEMVPSELAARVTRAVDVPTIGIGAGDETDGQVLVLHDLLGMDDDFQATFVKEYADVSGTVVDALRRYAGEVRSGAFPEDDHSFD
ncbi:MAG: 3-methyl-2-oxobutanoate hydroxymethyltransferase [Bradymonadaceae bacterium]